MANIKTNNLYYFGIAAKIRERTETYLKYKPYHMPDGIEAVYEKGYENGHTAGYTEGHTLGVSEGYDSGAKHEFDKFWDGFQDYGTRTDYAWAFRRWNADYIRPKYKVKNLSLKSDSLFQHSRVKKIEAAYFDLSGIDTLTGMQYGPTYAMFNACIQLEEIEDINIPAVDYYATWYNCTALKKIAVIRCASGKKFTSAFVGCSALEDVTFIGTLDTNGLVLSDSPKLSKASIESVINVLSSTASGKTVTLSKAAVNKAFETSTDANDGSTSAEWASLIGTKSNFTISVI